MNNAFDIGRIESQGKNYKIDIHAHVNKQKLLNNAFSLRKA